MTVRHRRCSASGTKLRTSSLATSRFTKRSASRKSFLRPRRPRFDCACARCSVPEVECAPCRSWQFRLPVALQRFPHGPPILCCRFHHHFLGLLLNQPCGQRAQCFGLAAKHSPRELVLPIDFNVGDDHVQHPFMDIDSRYLIGHPFLLLAGAESMPSVSLVRVTSYRQCDDAQLFAQHACSGSDKQTVSTYPLPTRSRCSEPQRILTLVDFHGLSRAEGPKGQTRN